MFRNRGIDYKFPRSSGGRFYFAKFDSGRVTTWQPPYIEPEPIVEVDELWSWNKQNINEFNSGTIIYLGNVTGSITASYFSGGVSDGKRYTPGVRLRASSNFITPLSGGMALIPIDPGFDLPKRYQLSITVHQSSISTPPLLYPGIYFNANQIPVSGGSPNTTNFHASCLLLNDRTSLGVRSFNITTGSIGNISAQKGSTPTANTYTLNFLIEMQSATGSSVGPRWRTQIIDASQASDTIQLHTGYINETSASNSSWSGVQNLNKFGIWIGCLQSGSHSKYIEIKEILIKKHPQE
jgi:hypothetical protein